MLTRRELAEHAAARGVPEAQILRDELISHVLAALPELTAGDLRFIGGTALCRTHLPGFRLSEDVDLLVADPPSTRDELSGLLPRMLRREYPDTTVDWLREGSTWSGELDGGRGLTVRIQLIGLDASYARYPTGPAPVELRYRDLPDAVELRVPTAPGAAAMKLNAWAERAAPRDLCDLFGLLEAGLLDAAALEIARGVSARVQPHVFDDGRLPSTDSWRTALSAQMRVPPSRADAFHRVRIALAQLAGWDVDR